MATLARVSLLAISHPAAVAGIRLRARHGARTTLTARVKSRRMLAAGASSAVRCAGGMGGAAGALRADEVDVEVPRSVPVRVAYELQQAGHRYLDVRTEGEFGGSGHPVGAVNIPYMHKTGSGMTKNTQFLEKVSATFGRDDEIIVGCQSGKRSLMAAAELCSAGFTAVTDIAGGFASWKENGLPINQ